MSLSFHHDPHISACSTGNRGGARELRGKRRRQNVKNGFQIKPDISIKYKIVKKIIVKKEMAKDNCLRKEEKKSKIRHSSIKDADEQNIAGEAISYH